MAIAKLFALNTNVKSNMTIKQQLTMRPFKKYVTCIIVYFYPIH